MQRVPPARALPGARRLQGGAGSAGGSRGAAGRGVFLLPLATAIAAAFLGGRFAAPRPDSVALWQGGGAGAGLLVGVIVARVLAARGRPGGEPE